MGNIHVQHTHAHTLEYTEQSSSQASFLCDLSFFEGGFYLQGRDLPFMLLQQIIRECYDSHLVVASLAVLNQKVLNYGLLKV